MLFSQADGDMIFMLLNVRISIAPEGHYIWKEAKTLS